MIPTILTHARSYLGVKEGDARHKQLIDRYNTVKPLPVGYKMKVSDDWCAAFVTVMGDLSGASGLIGRECGVHRFVEIFKKKGIWKGVVKPQAGDIVVFDWQKDGWTDHIGIVERFSGNVVTAIEGNTQKRVTARSYPYNNWRIAGYARPKYPKTKPSSTHDLVAREVIAGKWGNGEVRKRRLKEAGYDSAAVQQRVNQLLKPVSSYIKSTQDIAKEVVQGKWGNGDTRKKRLTESGYDYKAVQRQVNRLL